MIADDLTQKMGQLQQMYAPGAMRQMPAAPPQGGMLGMMAQQMPQTVGEQYQQFMANGGSMTPPGPQPQTEDEWRQMLYMRQKERERQGQIDGEKSLEAQRMMGNSSR